jgi:MraZ protein
MDDASQLILGEFSRRLDDRYRLSIPPDFVEKLKAESGDCVLAKERTGCISLWSAADWQAKQAARIELLESRLKLGDLDRNLGRVQELGRLLSTRHRPVQLAGRGRLVLPEGFREFLAVDPGEEIMIVGANVCIEIWNPPNWSDYVKEKMPDFRALFEELAV